MDVLDRLDGGREPKSWTWEEFRALPTEKLTTDIHCVTRWSKLDTTWEGVSLDVLLEGMEHDAPYALAFCDGGYTTNVPVADLLGGQAWVAFGYGGGPLGAEHGGPARLLVPHLYFWKSAKWVRGLRLLARTSPASGRTTATTCTETHGASSGTRATEYLADRHRRGGQRGDVPGPHAAALAGGAGRQHRAGQHVDVRLTAEDGYQAERAYSIASAPGEPLAITVERLDDGEVSPYLTQEARPGDLMEVRGPIGGYFVWEPAFGGPLLLAAGGSGIVPLRSMLRARSRAGSTVPVRLLYSSRRWEDVIYAGELDAAPAECR